MRVVPDCNVVVAAARVDGVCREVIDSVVRHHEIVLSEYEAVAERLIATPSPSERSSGWPSR